MFKAEKDHDKKVFGCKELVPADLDGLEEVDSHFVDSSGWGQKGDPALTAEEFLEKVTAGRFYAVTGVGQFQIHISEYVKIEEN